MEISKNSSKQKSIQALQCFHSGSGTKKQDWILENTFIDKEQSMLEATATQTWAGRGERAATPGRSLPSRSSRLAPPPGDTWGHILGTPAVYIMHIVVTLLVQYIVR